MSKISRKARAAVAPRHTVAADHHIEIESDAETPVELNRPESRFVDPAATVSADELATLPLRIVQAKKARVQVWRGTDGHWYRHGGRLAIQPCRDGVRRYVLILERGANRNDLDFLLRKVAEMRAGGKGRQWIKRGQDWLAHADDQTFTLAYSSRGYADPYGCVDDSPRVTPCDDPSCLDQWHETDYGVHHLERFEGGVKGKPGGYEIRVSRALCEDAWTVDVRVDDFYGSPDDVASLVNDLQWAARSCRVANEAIGTAST